MPAEKSIWARLSLSFFLNSGFTKIFSGVSRPALFFSAVRIIVLSNANLLKSGLFIFAPVFEVCRHLRYPPSPSVPYQWFDSEVATDRRYSSHGTARPPIGEGAEIPYLA